MSPDQFRRKVTRTTPARYVADYRYELECGHVASGEAGTTHGRAASRRSVICWDCRQAAAR
jgi:hypothetical protein